VASLDGDESGYAPGVDRLTNRDIARALAELADLVELAGDRDEEFRVRALKRGSREIERLAEPAVELLAARRLAALPGIGDGIARRVAELAGTGKLAELEEARRRAAGLVQVSRVDGIGSTTARALRDRLNVRSLEDLEAAAVGGRLRGVPGFSARKISDLLAAIDRARAARPKVRADLARKEVAPFLEAVRAVPGVVFADLCGSLVRRRDLVGDVDIMAATGDPMAVAEAFCAHRHAEVVLARGARSSVRTYTGLQVDVFCVATDRIGLAWHSWIGSKEHLIALRLLATRQYGLKINEDGIWDASGGRRPGGERPEDERLVYEVLEMAYVPPELREARGEIERARAGSLPRLISAADVRGDLHVHTGDGDGAGSLEEIAAAAAARGLEYLAVTDHSPARGGLGADALADQARRIRALNERLGGRPRLLAGVEVDVLPDGSLDLPSRALAAADFVIAGAHAALDLPRAEQTRRLVKAIESGLIDAVAHPSGRLVGQRDAIDVDIEEVVAAAARTDVALEINGHPTRHDLGDVHAFMARERRAWLLLGTDAHAPQEIGLLDGALDIARRAWVEPEHVLNTRPVGDLVDLLRARRREAGL
jgi:DNA polymerase (family 10)